VSITGEMRTGLPEASTGVALASHGATERSLGSLELAAGGLPGGAGGEVARALAERELGVGHALLCAEALDPYGRAVPGGGSAESVGAPSERAEQVRRRAERNRAGVGARSALQLFSCERVAGEGVGVLARPAGASACDPAA
jgi:hypothetical protein